MALKAVVEKIDELPEPARAFYAEKDGKFMLDVDMVVSIEDKRLVARHVKIVAVPFEPRRLAFTRIFHIVSLTY